MTWSLNRLAALLPWRRKDAHATEIYGAIVAQARLPVFYQSFGVADTLEGRFVVLSLHLFAVLHRLKAGGAQARPMAQELSDQFTADMETVLREIGVGDLKIPKKVRRLAASGAALLRDYEEAIAKGNDALAATIAHALPLDKAPAEAAAARLTPYLREMVRHLDAQSLGNICAGRLSFLAPELP